ncbi:DUF4232 domain-containing protein [Streptomyces sp. NPDC048434]|uniref:DUF4232 domain-containing protein n=1 Tax=Streptomyces sp. NPDC048434 TaxID=3365549 RepID=UPI00371BFB8B
MPALPSPRHAHKLAAAVLATAAAVALTACQDGKTTGSGNPSSAATSHSAGSDTASSGGDTAGGSQNTGGSTGSNRRPTAARSAASADNSSNRCAATSMRMRLGAPDAGAGNIRYALVLTNSGKQSCTLRGYPGVSLLAGDGQTIGKPAAREGGAGTAVTLAPGSSAHAVLHTLNEGLKGSGCWKGADLVQAFPPGSKESMTARTSGLKVCGNEFTVTAIAPGAAG